jgi:CRP-like cAMP-binding protein
MIGETLLAHLRLFGTLTDEDAAALRGMTGAVRKLGRDEDVLRVGDRPKEVVIVLSGLLHRYTLNGDGGRQIHSLYFPTDAPSLETLHMDYIDNSLAAVVPSEVGVIPHSELYRVMDARPKVLALAWRETLVQASIFRMWLMRNSRMPAQQSMAHLFCETAARCSAAGMLAPDGSCVLPITQTDLADILGLTPVHANRTLMMLRASGAVELRKGRLLIRDWATLSEIAEFDPAYLHLRQYYSPHQGHMSLPEAV